VVISGETTVHLSVDDRKALLLIARNSIAAAFRGGEVQSKPAGQPRLLEPSGAFVTLHLHGELRGCIGYIEALYPLYETVAEVAQKAAFEDPRFPPLGEAELKQVEIEISVLSPLKKITDPNEVEVGKHGLVIDAGYTRGLLLPQVAVEYGWNREQFLSSTARKAGLPSNAWKKPDISLYVFTSDVFAESQEQADLK
jgi:AmmeMemoRadiSam system protein A